jgi:hypothetical protein
MPRLKDYGKGRRVSVWISERNLKMWDEIENKSKFVGISLDMAIDIMAFAILQKVDPVKYKTPEKDTEKVLTDFNEQYPLDPLTAQRKNKHVKPADRSRSSDNLKPNSVLF